MQSDVPPEPVCVAPLHDIALLSLASKVHLHTMRRWHAIILRAPRWFRGSSAA